MRERKDLNKALGLLWSDAPHEIRCEIPRRVTTLTMAAGVVLLGFAILNGSAIAISPNSSGLRRSSTGHLGSIRREMLDRDRDAIAFVPRVATNVREGIG